MLKKILISSALLSMAVTSMSAQVSSMQPGKSVTGKGQREYSVIVHQDGDTVVFNNKLRSIGAQRGILMDLAQGYLSLGTSTILSASKDLMAMGVNAVKEAIRDKRPDWHKSTMEECRFVKFLPMKTQVLDFYSQPSSNGAIDPSNMKFSGFGCSQTINIIDEGGKRHEEEVFYVSCKLRDDDAGIARMLNHSKFEVVIDELRFNPMLCNLPNDSINPDPATRVEFSFDKRKDLVFNVDAVVSSSWINEAIQVNDDIELGRFHIQASIDPFKLDNDGVFRYKRGEADDAGKMVTVTGESFIVPRSYIGSSDMQTASDSWGTGQYRINMVISETCSINEAYYTEMKNGKCHWRKDRWMPEYKLIRQRASHHGAWVTIKQQVFPSLIGDRWVTTITEPFTSTLINYEGKWINAAAESVIGKKGAIGDGARVAKTDVQKGQGTQPLVEANQSSGGAQPKKP